MTALCAVVFAPAAGAAIFKCQDAQGKVTYQQKPCEGATAAPPGAPALTDAKGAPLASADQKSDTAILAFLVQKHQCDLGHPEIARQTKVSYERWRERNAKEVAKVEASAEYRAALGDAQKAKNPALTPATLDKACQSVVQQLDQEARAAEPRRQPTAR
jgi:hypothetical protein